MATKEVTRKPRAYHSPRRQEQAGITKARIVSAAVQLLREKGYADMTLEAIAREAGVAPQTVYAVCGSKKGVLAAILENAVESRQYDKFRDRIPEIKDGRARLQEIGHFISLLHQESASTFYLMRGMGTVSPELGDMEADNERMLYEKSLKQIMTMARDGLLRPDLDVMEAADTYWALISPGVFRRLTRYRGWTTERYAAWLAKVLEQLLLKEPGEEAASLVVPESFEGVQDAPAPSADTEAPREPRGKMGEC